MIIIYIACVSRSFCADRPLFFRVRAHNSRNSREIPWKTAAAPMHRRLTVPGRDTMITVPESVGDNYNGKKKFNAVVIVKRIVIYYLFPDTLPEYRSPVSVLHIHTT
jgi:hypothetical protein